ncbi:PKD domain-containing protein [Chitinophaga filiformis]|uniref:Por secretion system C-terminal sorting domain-containing protein n=1 Tax=Chitinophaga filiformis TaxID=104663 RepID=A0A1G7Y7H2_CHIFI|nr:PKD domain-containing protein [Chitinophaga filiformis]SDG92402.1 Por secretion system C-terminal sorting domain-containing protein [Chitinophaga filiformis]
MKETLQLFLLLLLSQIVSAQQRNPDADYVQSGTQSCAAPFSVSFKDNSRSPINAALVAWKWEFGDGTIDSSGPNVTHTYTQKGIFTVKLTVRDQFGNSATINGNQYNGPVRIGAALQLLPAYAFCSNTLFPFTLKNELAPANFDSLGTYRWFRNETQVGTAKDLQINSEGTYTVAYTACGTTLYDTTLVGPLIGPDVAANYGSAMTWTSNGFAISAWVDAPSHLSTFNKLMWYWGDGTTSTSTRSNRITHYYTNPGQYRISVKPYYEYGNNTLFCSEAALEMPAIIRENRVKHNSWNGRDTILSITATPLTLSAGNTGASFNWRSEDPSFSYYGQTLAITKAGKYWVDIKENAEYADAVTDSIRVTTVTRPTADFLYTITPCHEQSVSFNGAMAFPEDSQDRVIAWLWRIDDESVNTAATFIYNFGAYGMHTVELVAFTQSGVTYTVAKQINVPRETRDWAIVLKDDTLSIPGVHILTATTTPAGIPVYFEGYNQPTASLHVTAYGSYSAFIKDSCGLERARDTIEILAPGSSQWNFGIKTVYKDNCMTGAWLKAVTDAPAGTYTVTWNTGIVSDSIHVTTGGNYSAVFKDNTGKTRTANRDVTIEQPIVPTITLQNISGRDYLIPTPVMPNQQYYWYRNDSLVGYGSGNQNSYGALIRGIYFLGIEGATGCYNTSMPFEYHMPKDSIIASFSFSREHCDSLKVTFKAGIYTASSSTDTVRSIIWNYGDGTSETLTSDRMPQHLYATAGIYTVKMTARTVSGRQITVSGAVTIDPIPNYSVKITDDVTSLPGVHILKATVTPAGQQVLWSTGVRRDTIHVLKAGYYKATVKDTCSSILYTDSLEVKASSITTWSLDALISKIFACQDSAMLIANAKGPLNGYSLTWNNGENKDTTYVRSSGTYIVRLIDKQGNIRARDTVQVTLIRPLEASITLRSAPSGDTLAALPDSSGFSYKWYRNDTLLPTVTTPLNIRPIRGSYVVEVQNQNGCKSRSIPFFYEGKAANLSFTYTTDPCLNYILQFNGPGFPEDSMVAYSWNFGDNATSVLQNPLHEFKPGKTYTVSLSTRTKSGLKGFTSREITVELIDYTPTITVRKTPCGDGAWLIANTTLKVPVLDWSNYGWDDSTLVTSSGRYTLTVRDTCHNVRGTAFVDVDLKPYFIPSWDFLRKGEHDTIVILSNRDDYVFSIDNPSPDITFTWWRDGEIVRVSHEPYFVDPLDGDYKGLVEIKGGCGNYVDAILNVGYLPPLPDPVSFTYDTLGSACLTQVSFHGPASVPGDSILRYTWDFGDLNAGSTQEPVHSYRPGTYNVFMRVVTASGKQGLARRQLVIKSTGEEWTAKINSNPALCGDKATLSVDAPAEAAYIEWNTGATTRDIQVTSSGNYTVTVFDSCHNIRAADTIHLELSAGFQPELAYGLIEDTLAIYQAVGNSAIFPLSDALPGYTFTWYFNDKELPTHASYITPITPGNYQVKVVQPNGCPGLTSIYSVPETEAWPDTVTFGNQTPVFDIQDDLSVAGRFHWPRNPDNVYTLQLTLSNPEGRMNGLEPGQVITLTTLQSDMQSVTLTAPLPDSLACSSNYAIRIVSSSPADTTIWSVPVTIINQPEKPIITQRGDSLFTNSNYQLQWYKNDIAIPGAMASYYRARANASYTVEAYNGGDCRSRSSSVAVVITAVGEVTLGTNKVKAFPNPSEGEVYLKFEKPLLKPVVVNVHNLQGRVVYNTTTSQRQHILYLSALPKGYYMVELMGYGTKKVLSLMLY